MTAETTILSFIIPAMMAVAIFFSGMAVGVMVSSREAKRWKSRFLKLQRLTDIAMKPHDEIQELLKLYKL